MGFRRSIVVERPLPRIADRFGVRSLGQLGRDLREVVAGALSGARFQAGPSSAALLRPDLSLPAYRGLLPDDGRAPIFNLFDRVGGGQRFSARVTRRRVRDYRGGRLSYDEHDGTDFVCPIGTPLVAAAPGIVALIRDRWLRGGLTVAVDHGHGVVTQYTHCARALLPVGTSVRRGDPVALSGAAGYDLVQFFPLVPPHIHFMVWVDGRPVDPFLAAGEPHRAGLWLAPADPRPSAPLAADPATPEPSPVDDDALLRLRRACLDARIRGEIDEHDGEPWALAALLEDALHHEGWAWPDALRGASVRPAPSLERAKARDAIAFTLPLPAEEYRGAYCADSRFTRPRS